MKKIAIIFGGRSLEHDVSLLSATSVLKAIKKDIYEIVTIGITKDGQWLLYDGDIEHIATGKWEEIAKEKNEEIAVLGSHQSLKDYADIAFPVLHGPYGEDGTIQGLFEMINMPYVGGSVIGTSTAMDKIISKRLFHEADIPVCQYTVVMRNDIVYDIQSVLETVQKQIEYPMFIKPANLGSSVGITKAHDVKELEEGLLEAIKHDRRVLIEENINCREIETAVIGNDDPKVAAVGEVVASNEFYDYEAKYLSNGASKVQIPAKITKDQESEIKDLAIKAYKALDLCGFSRIDFFIDKDTNQIYINEINSIPGFTQYSMFPLLWEEAGVNYSDLVDKLIMYAEERHKEKNKEE